MDRLRRARRTAAAMLTAAAVLSLAGMLFASLWLLAAAGPFVFLALVALAAAGDLPPDP